MTDKNPSHTNRLAAETSPYLLQHAHNPVDWYPWGDEAFEKARSENKPIFLSVGYSTCHWCHVMERESFENQQTAILMNDLFVCIKVDREERPDIDEVYMQAAQLLTGQGGWPLSVFLDTELRPFYAGTYFPPVNAHGRPGFPRLLQALSRAFHERPEDIAASASDLVSAISENASATAQAGTVDMNVLERAAAVIYRNLDGENGGFGAAPKFPPSMALQLLLRQYRRSGDRRFLDAVVLTVQKMVRGGIFDQVGGGFHRYSTDALWLVPHFEKMLYDNALMLGALVETWQVTHLEEVADAAHRTVDFVLREMRNPDGSFASALDADTEGVEGLFYVWTPSEVEAAVGSGDASLFSAVYGITGQGNFEHGRSIPHLRDSLESALADASERDADTSALRIRLQGVRERLLEAREARQRPGLDDKSIVSWNGLMIAAMARFGRVFGRQEAVNAASQAADAIEALVKFDGRLGHSLRAGKVSGPAYQEDYACYAGGLIDLYEATGDVTRLHTSRQLLSEMVDLFWDTEGGGFYFSQQGHSTPLVRSKNPTDGVTPSGNSSAALAMARLSALLDMPEMRQRALETVQSLAGLLDKAPRAFENLLLAADFLLSDPQEVVIAGSPAEQDSLVSLVNETFLPNAVIAWNTGSGEVAPAAGGKLRVDGRTAVYVCRNYACQAPATSGAELKQLL